MHVLAIFSHPRRDSFTGSILDQFKHGVTEAGHSIEIADLYREGFEPRLQPEDYAQFKGQPMPEMIIREHIRFERADALAFVFPVWWWSFPAILKGWIDRVWCEGWAYTFQPQRSRGLLQNRPTILLATAGSRESTYRKYRYDEAMRIQIEIGILGYGGISDIDTHFFYEVDNDVEARKRYLELARQLGQEFLSPNRPASLAEYSSDRPA